MFPVLLWDAISSGVSMNLTPLIFFCDCSLLHSCDLSWQNEPQNASKGVKPSKYRFLQFYIFGICIMYQL